MSSDRIFPIRSVLQSGVSRSTSSVGQDEVSSPITEDDLLVWSNGRFVNCDEEPIHIPGSIQSYGALIAVREDTWQVRQVSENSADVIGIDPQKLLKIDSLKEVLSEESISYLEERIESISYFPEDSGPDIFRIFFLNDPDQTPLYCALHRNEENGEILIMEFAREGGFDHPGYQHSDDDLNLDAKSMRRLKELRASLEKFNGQV